MNRREFLKLTPATILSIPLLGDISVNPDKLDFWQAVTDTMDSFDARYKGMPIKEYPLKPSYFSYNIRAITTGAAREWGIVPSEFDKLPIDDQIRICAWCLIKAQIEAIEMVEHNRKQAKRVWA